MRMLIGAIAGMTLAGGAAAQSDPRPQAQLDWAAALNSNISGAKTQWGWISDLYSYGGSGSGCTSNIYKYQRTIYRGNRRSEDASTNTPIDWKQVDNVDVVDDGPGYDPAGLKIYFRNGETVYIGFMSEERANNALWAANTLLDDCQRVLPAIPQPGSPELAKLPAQLTAEFARVLPSLVYLHDRTGTRQALAQARVEGCFLHITSNSGLMLGRVQPYAGGSRITFLNPDGSRSEVEGPSEFIAYAARGLYALKGNCPS